MPDEDLLIARDGSEHVDGLSRGQWRGGFDGDRDFGFRRHRDKIVATQDVIDQEASSEECMERRWAGRLVVEVTGSRTNLNELDIVSGEGRPRGDIMRNDPNRRGLGRVRL